MADTEFNRATSLRTVKPWRRTLWSQIVGVHLSVGPMPHLDTPETLTHTAAHYSRI